MENIKNWSFEMTKIKMKYIKIKKMKKNKRFEDKNILISNIILSDKSINNLKLQKLFFWVFFINNSKNIEWKLQFFLKAKWLTDILGIFFE